MFIIDPATMTAVTVTEAIALTGSHQGKMLAIVEDGRSFVVPEANLYRD